jgi:hypothetical protein
MAAAAKPPKAYTPYEIENANRDPYEDYYGPSWSCYPVKVDEETTLYARIQAPDDWSTSATRKPRTKTRLNRSNPLYTSTAMPGHLPFPEAPEGIYVWVFSEKGFFAVKVRSPFEFGTKHKTIVAREGVRTILFAGECRLSESGAAAGGGDGRRIATVNLLSGTYTKYMMEDLPAEVLKESILDPTQHLFESMGFQYVAGDKTLITNDLTPVTMEELREYQLLGHKVYLFKTRADCLNYGTYSARITFLEQQARTTPYEALKEKALAEKGELEKKIAESLVVLGPPRNRSARQTRRMRHRGK